MPSTDQEKCLDKRLVMYLHVKMPPLFNQKEVQKEVFFFTFARKKQSDNNPFARIFPRICAYISPFVTISELSDMSV